MIEGRLIQRYKRFLADVELMDGQVVTAHTPNTGSMMGCTEPGSRVWLRAVDDPKRKYRYAWELVEVAPGTLVGINTALSNRLVGEAIENGTIVELQGYERIRREVRYGQENSRIDLLLERSTPPGSCYVEVKNVTLAEGGVAYFPDAVSARGAKHLRELKAVREAGYRAVIVFCVQRNDAREFRPADAIDPAYGRILREALSAGVEALAYRAQVEIGSIALDDALPVYCPPDR